MPNVMHTTPLTPFSANKTLLVTLIFYLFRQRYTKQAYGAEVCSFSAHISYFRNTSMSLCVGYGVCIVFLHIIYTSGLQFVFWKS